MQRSWTAPVSLTREFTRAAILNSCVLFAVDPQHQYLLKKREIRTVDPPNLTGVACVRSRLPNILTLATMRAGNALGES